MSDAVSIHHGQFGRVGLYRLDRPMATHAHRESHLVFYIGGGRATAEVDGFEYQLGPKIGIAINAMEPHSFIPAVDGEPCNCLVFYFRSEWLLTTSEFTAQLLRFGTPTIRKTPVLSRLIRHATSLLTGRKVAGIPDDLLYDIYFHSYQQSWPNLDLPELQSRARPPLASSRIRKSLQLLQQQYALAPSTDLLAQNVGLSRPYLFPLFKKEVGSTPSVYLNTLRIEHAIREITTTKKTIETIGWDLGFSSQSSFSRFFSANVGVPPAAYRRAGVISPSTK